MIGWRYVVMIVGISITWLIIGISIGYRHGKSNMAKRVLKWGEGYCSISEKEKK